MENGFFRFIVLDSRENSPHNTMDKYEKIAMAGEITARADEIFSRAEILADRVSYAEQVLAYETRNAAVNASMEKLEAALVDLTADHEVARKTQECEELDAHMVFEKKMTRIDEDYTNRIHAALQAHSEALKFASSLM